MNFQRLFYALLLFRKITSITPNKIKITPHKILNVNCSLKNKTPTTIAVKGSKAPRIAVEVEPINLIAIVIVSIEIIVGNIDNPNVHIHKNGECKTCN